ncbi:hypothetical protein BHE74_00014681 [Ensete ventricosum]|nr:hypothetical protein BHE74_00014681 [Ensete ventricosum]
MGTARICPPTDRYVDHPLSGGTYQFVSRSVRKPPSIGQYHRLRLFSPRYHSKSVGNGRFRVVSADGQRRRGRRKGRTWSLALLSRSRSVAHGRFLLPA